MAAATRTQTDGRRLGGLPKVLAAAGAMGTLGPVAALAYGEGVGPATFSALRAGIGAAILGVLSCSAASRPSASPGCRPASGPPSAWPWPSTA